jgi:MtN3 and saliva related transmembrane protein
VDPELAKLATLAATVGGMLSVGALLPQAWRILKRRSAVDISLAMYLTILVACALWIFYAWVNGATEVLVTNVAIAVIALFIIALKLRYGSR